MDYKDKIIKQLKNLTYSEAMSELSRNMNSIKGDWDSIVSKNGKWYKYNYERKHSYRAEYGEEVYGETLKKYLAFKEVYDGLSSGKIKAGVSKTISLD